MTVEMTKERERVRPAAYASREGPNGFLREACQAHRKRLAAQPPETKRAVEEEAGRLGELLARPDPVWHAAFMLPERVAVGSDNEVLAIEETRRSQHIGSWVDRVRGQGLRSSLRTHLLRLEQASDRAVATGAKLIRHATASWIIHHAAFSPAVRAPLAQEGQEPLESDNGSQNVAEDRSPFQAPQWVAFDAQDRLLVESEAQAESYLGLLQDALAALRAAISLAPYMIADDDYQAKRSGLLAQLADQGRALARFQTREIVAILRRRTLGGQLNRGLKVSVPYYDDQALRIVLRTFDIIPAGRIMFVPALGMRAVQDEQAKVAQDTRLSSSTRDHLMEELEMLLRAFLTPAVNSGPEVRHEGQPEGSPS
jgi:hypothetical protein